jgi:hypothetical protein
MRNLSGRTRGAPGRVGGFHPLSLLPDAKMEFTTRSNDWATLEARHPKYIEVRFNIPYAVFENEPEKTLDPALIGKELERVTRRLMET